MTAFQDNTADMLELGLAALRRGAWAEARSALQAAAAQHPADASAWESLGVACMWLQDTRGVLESRQRAYALYREAGHDIASARVAIDLAGDYLDLRGEPAVANGWLQRARRLLEDEPPSREHASLRIWDAYLALTGAADTAAAQAHAADAVAISESAGVRDTAILGLALHGLALVTEGRVRAGMALLDEAVAAAVGGEFGELQYVCLACCCMIDACDQVRDYGRALQWCERLRELATRWRVQSFLTTCRVKYSGVLLWRGEWDAAELELTDALRELSAAAPTGTPAVLVRLAELRRRQGREAEAKRLLEQAPTHPQALLVRAAMALDASDPATAVDLTNVALRRIPASARMERIVPLELNVRANIALGQLDDARPAVAELEAIADAVATDSLRAAALAAAGLLAAAAADHESARTRLQDAAALLESSGSPYEAARARVELARSLAALGRTGSASAEASSAVAILERVGAEVDAARGRELLEGRQHLLTRRQRDVLDLIAQGLSDREIAARLVLSEHTVHRHVANILGRLGVATRTAAVARALRGELMS